MIDVKVAYSAAKKLTSTKNLKRILSFNETFGFVFKNTDDEGICILIDKNDPEVSTLIPLGFAQSRLLKYRKRNPTIDFLNTGKEIPLSIIK